jgi:hypothetical protein
LRQADGGRGLAAAVAALRRPGAHWIAEEAAWHALEAGLARAEAQPPVPEDALRRDAAYAEAARLTAEKIAAPGFPERHALVRRRALSALAHLPVPEARALLIETLRREGPGTLVAVAGRLPAEPDAELGAALGSSPEALAARTRARVRREGAGSLAGAIASPLAAERAAAVEAAPAGSLETFALALADPAAIVRRAALWRLLEGVPRPEAAAAAGAPDSGSAARLAALGRVLALGGPEDWPDRRLAAVCLRGAGAPIASPGEAAAPPSPCPYLPELEEVLSLPRDPRAEVRVRGRGVFLVELFAGDAPHHVASLLHLSRAGALAGLRVEALEASLGATIASGVSAAGALAATPIPPEPRAGVIPAGALISLPGHWPRAGTLAERRLLVERAGGGPSRAGAFAIAYIPLPELQGIASPWGRVVQGMEVAEGLLEGDEVESVSFLLHHRSARTPR